MDDETTTQPQTPEAVPTVPGERRPVTLPQEGTEAARRARTLAALGITPPEPPPAEPPADTPPAADEPADPPAAPPAPPAEPPPAAQSEGAAQLAEMFERLRALETDVQGRAAKLAEDAARLKRYQDFEEALKTKDVLGALESLGYSFDDLSRAAVEGRGVETQTGRLEKQLAELRAEIERDRQERERAEQQAQLAELQVQADTEIDEAIATHSPLLKVYGERARAAVWERLRQHWTESGGSATLPLDRAVADVERDFRALVMAPLGDETLRAQFLGQGASDPAAPVTSGRSPTLTNEHVAATPRRAESDVISEEERRARALQHLK